MLKVFFISMIIYLYLAFLLRIVGKKEFSQLNVFDFVVFLVISEIMTLSLESLKINLVECIIATITFVLLDQIETYLSLHSKKLRNLFEGTPRYLLLQGKLQKDQLKKAHYTVDDLCHQLRVKNIESLSQVEFAVLENNGSLSIITKEDSISKIPDSLICDGKVNEQALSLIGKDINWLKNQLKKHHIQHIDDVFYCVLETDRLYIIKK